MKPDTILVRLTPLLHDGSVWRRGVQSLLTTALAVLGASSITTANAQYDYGDAPVSYGTRSVNNGPHHIVTPWLRLGVNADTEADGQPGPPANGDDNAGSADEDGVQIFTSFPDRIVGAQIGAWSQLRVAVDHPIAGSAFVNAWVDFNGDGDFLDAGERILTNAPAVDGINDFGFFTPDTVSPGFTYARIRLSDITLVGPGGFGGNGEVEDYRIDCTRPSQANNVQAHERFGQRWITWEFNPVTAAQVYEVYWSPLPMAAINTGTLVARLFPDDYCGPRLVRQLIEAFGTNTANRNFTIPNALGSGTTTLADNQGLCVETIRTAIAPGYYAVVPRGQTGVPAASQSALVPASFAGLGDANRPKPHLQQAGLVNNNHHGVAFYTFWADGDDNSSAGRLDFPVMGNFARRSVPHHFMLVAPNPAPTNGPQPLALSLHGGNGTATHWLPGGMVWNKEGGHATEGYSIGLEDRVPQIVRGRPEAITSRWLGWVATWDPFENAPPLPPNGEYIQPYTLTRLNWLLDWVLNRSGLNVDANRVAVRGMSLGSLGALLWAHTSPDRFSHLTMHVPPLHWSHIWPDREPLYGTDDQNLRIAGLTNASGNPLRFRHTLSLTENLAPDAQPLPTKIFSGKRDEWWSVDYEADFEPDLMQDIRAADLASGALGVQFWWDQRQHEAEAWMLSEAGGSPGACPNFTTNDFWIPTLGTQTRRDDVEAHFRFRKNQSYPAFYQLQTNTNGHGDPGTVEYDGVPFQQITDREGAPYSGVNDPCNPGLPVVTGDRRGTWGGYFDWFTESGPEAPRDNPQQWACSVTLVNDTDAGGRSVSPIDNAPTNTLSAKLAIRRPQNFTPPAGTPVLWMEADRASGQITQSGFDEVGPQGVVKLDQINVPRLPNIARVLVATHADLGDAPTGYPVTFAENGAYHASDSPLRLGATRNVETNGVHSPTALSAAEADDGVSGPALWPQDSLVTLNIVVNQACRLDAWVDWTRNSRWEGTVFDAFDRIANSIALVPGTNLFQVVVPTNAPVGTNFARFRVSTAGGLASTGAALDGEVEDYPLIITAPVQPPGSGLITHFVIPSTTDPEITTTNFNQPHAVVLATNVPALGKLLLHLPGTDSNPQGALEWLRTAATLGYHAIGLKYQNEPSMAALCTVNTNLDCYEDTTDETVTGLFHPDNLTNVLKQVRRADSIENRVQKLLAGLVATAPASQNWGQFLDATGGVRWSEITLSGHSQGGSCALFLAKTRRVDRAVVFATVDWILFPTNRQPAWFANPSLTPAERIYGFTHRLDSVLNGFWQQPPIWDDIEISTFGPLVFIESNAPPYSRSHTLTSLLQPAATNANGSFKYHNSVITDDAVPRTVGGEVAWLPAWSYMLTNVTESSPTLLTLATNASGRWQVSWPGNSGYSSQLEHSRDLMEWFRLDLPAPEVDAIMALELPPYLLADSEHFFRLARPPLVTSPIPTTPGFYTDMTFVQDGIARNYYLQVPAGWTAATNWPLMLALPGHGQSIAEFANLQQELISLASSNGMILVFAEATTGVDSYRWFAYENPNTGQPYIDDAAFLLALVNELVASGLNVNTNRIYLSGFSNGGSMTHFMASRTNHPFAAFAILESGTAGVTAYREPYNRLAPDSGTNLLVNVPLPWQPRPVMLMNMATSVPWVYEGRGLARGARHNVARWTQANGFGAPVTNGLGVIEPPPTALQTTTNWTAAGNARARVAYHDIRPDHNWPTNLVAGGWTLANALRFPYVGLVGTNVVDQRLPEWVRLTYPHTLSPDPVSPTTHVRVDSGTMTVELWRSAPLNRTNEVIFIGLSDGGHQWPNAADKLPFDASLEVLRFFGAH